MILVTGGAGFIGSELVRKLLEHGEKIRVFDKLYFGKDSLADVEKRIELIQGDIRDFDPAILEGIDKVVHLAALSNDPTAEYNPSANEAINYHGTKNLAEQCKKKGIHRFVYASSCSIYYTLDVSDEILTEETPVNPTAPYSKTKYDGEQFLKSIADDSFCPVFLRKATVFGQSHRMRYDLVVNTFTLHSHLKDRLTVFGGGEMWRPLVDIQDAVDAYIACLNAPEEKVHNQIFNLLHKNYRILELAHWIKYVLRDRKKVEVDVHYVDNTPTRSYRVAGEKIENTIGFKCSRGVSQAVNIMWTELIRKTREELEDPRNYNIRWMTQLVEMEERLKTIGYVF
ncbi:MAG: NAD-dependent epimerase/dehydratase family protein [Candidatus Xenobiia bacterium LiM19]